ncbi:class III lanthionine synthetase LanKC [Streptomyces hainanensis]|uniref:Lantipeptide synthetase n=1 Tax=Streptomyces hainanensis TaxID=402648 RepID=A0A4V2Y1P6_9ACTN|nr:class III lanthionine synthetase LanKC [Streptomyces hainanensis]TDC69545.1 lantipeptide synthetase [Streptomyces hainanensis]
MDKRYEVFCLIDRCFYDTPERLAMHSDGRVRTEESYETALRRVPDGWRGARNGDWLHLQPVAAELPLQGWKIHVSATLDGADGTAARIWEYCVPRGIPFKFVPARHLLFLRNSKYAGRDNSGKFATLYPADERQLHTVLTELGELLAGEPGPYVLTDLRWREGPLYVRYGAFAPRHCDDGSGNLVTAIEDGAGRLVPDRRTPTFSVPDWVTLPDFLAPQLAARNQVTVADLPYRVDRALHFSNGGGVYRGTDLRTGEAVVLKEARPHAGLAADTADAVTRLEREKAALERVSGLGIAPEVRDWFTLGEHRFLVMDELPGRTLNSFFAERHPLLAVTPDRVEVAGYTRWARTVLAGTERAVAALHGRGLVFNDLHMFNIMVAPDGESVSLLDFEAAAPESAAARQTVAHPGFLAPADRTGFAVDRYALACLRLALFIPLTSLLAIDPGKAAHLAEVAGREFPDLPAGYLAEAVTEILGGDAPTPRPASAKPAAPATRPDPAAPVDGPAARESMVRALLSSATPDREDRLFPGDIAQFSPGGGLGLAHGAAGVLHALAECGAERYEEGEKWLLRQAAQPPQGTPLGLYDGLLGVAHVLHRLGHTEAAHELASRALGERWERLPAPLFGGLAGIGLVLDELAAATGDDTLAAGARRATELAAARLSEPPEPRGRRRAGLLHGATGTALLLLRRHERTGEGALLDLAATALRRDLAHCAVDRRGMLNVDEGDRVLPYLGEGSVGIAAVLDDYLAHVADPEFERARATILPGAALRYYAQPGLFRGRAGMVWHLARTTTPGATPAALAAQAAAMDWYGMSYQGELAFPGDQMMRLSMDLATGTAGCLLALGAAEARAASPTGGPGHGPRLPFLPPPGRP